MVGIVGFAVHAGDAAGRRDDDEKREKVPAFSFRDSRSTHLLTGGVPWLRRILLKIVL